jgi:hypothetical protein
MVDQDLDGLRRWKMKIQLMIGLSLLFFVWGGTALGADKIYIGSEACQQCHDREYATYKAYAKKAKSFDSIKKMEKKLTPEEYRSCFECHTTGYGRQGGFISEEKTPELKNAGCEVCHGPGSTHADSEDPDDIIREIDMENCDTCHSSDRIKAFDFKPLLFGGAH